ncbi:MAG: M24 family metallopeptidase [Planctomycetota bacterium]|nr:M24 family metallopeptidase [Planctomycetota bacterium]
MFDLNRVQQALTEFSLDGWLLYDFRGSNLLARRVLGFPDDVISSRRFCYFIPANGPPRKLVHRIESGVLDQLSGEKLVYLRWQEFESELATLVNGSKTVAMEYSPRNSNPYVSRVDAGMVELVRQQGVNVVSSGNLVQLFEAVWDDEQWEMHLEAEKHTLAAFDAAWRFIANHIREKHTVTEKSVGDEIMNYFEKHDLVTSHPPIVAVDAHSGDPHYETGSGSEIEIRNGSFVLIDLWAKLNKPRSVYSDLTRVGFVGQSVPECYEKIFSIVAQARDAAILAVTSALSSQRPLPGYEVDRAARGVIDKAGHAQHFVHRTGHSIGQETHGNGANIDDLETHEERHILPRTCFSIEPGIYLPEFGIRSEVNVYVDGSRQVHVTGGPPQRTVIPIMQQY